jgi:Arc/MetJ family transcription regulator
MKRTNIVIDENLIAAGKKATGMRTSRELVDLALRELVRRSNQKQILKLRGKIRWEGDLHQMRQMRGTV